MTQGIIDRPSGGRQRKVAFYAPMKPPGHASPSGDREIARLLMTALRLAGHGVTLASPLRTYLGKSDDKTTHDAHLVSAADERDRISDQWKRDGPPDLWVSYHPYYKSPDLLGPDLCRAHNVPWVTIEASHSRRRSIGLWDDFQKRSWTAITGAKVNIALTRRDMNGLLENDPSLPLAHLGPFLDARPFLETKVSPEPAQLITVAMMRGGDKADSYAFLARALAGLTDCPWHLTIVGDGPARDDVRGQFESLPKDRLSWVGRLNAEGVRSALARASIFVWPGLREAFGMVYLEAQAMGLPVVALDTAGVPEVVAHGETGLLSPPADEVAYASAVRNLLTDQTLRNRLSSAARSRVAQQFDLAPASTRLESILRSYVWRERE